jgi:ATP-binding cassette subfamily F protein 3
LRICRKNLFEEIFSANTQLTYVETKRIAATMMFRGALSEKKIAVLSGGEKSRVLLGKILAKPCNLLLLDEPTHHLDIESVESLIDALETFSGAIIIVTHSELLLNRVQFDSLIVCHEDRQEFFRGSYAEFLEKKGWEEEEKEPVAHVSRSNDKRKRAEFVVERAQAMRPIQQEIKKLEHSIMVLEEIQKKDETLLFEAYEKEDAATIQTLSKKTGQQRKEIDTLFEKLMEQGELLEHTKKMFEEGSSLSIVLK